MDYHPSLCLVIVKYILDCGESISTYTYWPKYHRSYCFDRTLYGSKPDAKVSQNHNGIIGGIYNFSQRSTMGFIKIGLMGISKYHLLNHFS